jgi:D-glycero-alpha-D-manno-heptose 1-phosphate guanylyltransferase
MQALILAGGRGERLRPLTDNVPKPMLLVQGKPFLSYLVKSLSSQGIADFIFATGYKGEVIESYFHSGQDYGIKIQYSKEDIPLGTAGPVKKAGNLINGEDLLVLNGDTFVQIDLKQMANFHQQMGKLITIAAVRVENPGRYGQLVIQNGVISEFKEKGQEIISNYINAGVYIFKKEILKYFSGEKQDFEKDIFPKFLNNIATFKTAGYFIDIGVKEDYYRFNEEIKNLSIFTS